MKNEKSFGATPEPFFFQDLDFDNSKELIIKEAVNGQRGGSSFKAYKIKNGYLESDLYNITYNEPYKSLDEMSKIDYTKKQITISKSGGSCGSVNEIYKLMPSKNEYEDKKFALESLIVYEQDEKLNKCFELNYKVINQSKQLISKKVIK